MTGKGDVYNVHGSKQGAVQGQGSSALRLSHAQREDSEHRRNRRISLNVPVGLAIASAPKALFLRHPEIQGTILNASMSGLQVLVVKSIPDKAPLVVWIELKTHTPSGALKLRGECRWSKPHVKSGGYLVGIRLEARPKDGMAAWSEAILQRLRLLDL